MGQSYRKLIGKRRELDQKFFNRGTIAVAKNLLGKFLVKRERGKRMALMITEVEVYDGFRDRGSHAHRKTPRAKVMFGPPGYWYVYFTYGMHWMLNAVTREKEYPAAVLVRGVEGFKGPGRLTKYLKINGRFNGKPISRKSGLWVEDREVGIPAWKIKRGPRVGIDYAGPIWSKKQWRFWIEGYRC